jgi:hypothetical protein
MLLLGHWTTAIVFFVAMALVLGWWQWHEPASEAVTSALREADEGAV